MIMLKHYSNLIDQVATRMYESNDEYMYLSFEQALPRIKPIIMSMNMAEMLDYIKEETTDADIKRLNQTNHSHSPICFGWIRLEQPTILKRA